MEVRVTKSEIEKLIRKHLAHTTITKWANNELVLDIDVLELNEEKIRGERIWVYKEKAKMVKGKYCICPLIKKDEKNYFLVIQ
jgi:hypothetical protein